MYCFQWYVWSSEKRWKWGILKVLRGKKIEISPVFLDLFVLHIDRQKTGDDTSANIALFLFFFSFFFAATSLSTSCRS